MIVAIDGASTDLSLAILGPRGELLGEDAWSSDRRQSSELLPRLLALLERHGRALADVTGIGIGSGPGSFTGLRVAMALGKGIAVALDRPIVGVPSLEAWLAAEPSASAAVARAGAREGYVLARDEQEPVIADRDRLRERLAGAPIVAPVELVEAFGLRGARSPSRSAAAIGRIAAGRLAADAAGDDLARLEPRYLRAPRGIEDQGESAVRWL